MSTVEERRAAMAEAQAEKAAAQSKIDALVTENMAWEAEQHGQIWSIKQTYDALVEIGKKSAAHARMPLRDSMGRPIGSMHSWRGIYSEPAIGEGWTEQWTVSGLRNRLESAVKNGEVFEGYKGGDYTYGWGDALHVDEYGEYHDTGVIGVELRLDHVEIVTQTDLEIATSSSSETP